MSRMRLKIIQIMAGEALKKPKAEIKENHIRYP